MKSNIESNPIRRSKLTSSNLLFTVVIVSNLLWISLFAVLFSRLNLLENEGDLSTDNISAETPMEESGNDEAEAIDGEWEVLNFSSFAEEGENLSADSVVNVADVFDENAENSIDNLKRNSAEITEIKIISDNRFDNNFDGQGYFDTNTGEVISSSSWKYTKRFYELDESNTYQINIEISEAFSGLGLLVYDENKTLLKYYPLNNITSAGCVVENAKYFRLYAKTTFEGLIYVAHKRASNPVDYSFAEKNVVIDDNDFSEYRKNLKGKTIVNFGDSIFGNFRDETSISSVLSKLSGATVYNCGFGGCKMANQHRNVNSDVAWNAFSMHSLADAITSKDFRCKKNMLLMMVQRADKQFWNISRKRYNYLKALISQRWI